MQRAAWIVGFWLLAALRAHAQAGAQVPSQLPLELEWQAPAECGSAADVRAELERIARVVKGHALSPLRAHARVEHAAGGYTMQLATEHEGERGERRLEAADCDTLVRSVTLVLALAFGKGVEVAAPSQTDSGAPQPAAAPEVAPAPATATAPPTRSEAPAASSPPSEEAPEESDDEASASVLRLSLLLGGGVHFALLPDPAPGAALGVELASSAWSVALRGGGWPASTTQVGLGLGARFDGLSGALQGCGLLPVAPLELGLCAAAIGAALRGRSEGAFEDGSDTAPWYALSSAANATWPAAGILRVRLEAALAVSLVRHRFVVAGFGPVHRVPLLVPQLGLMLSITP